MTENRDEPAYPNQIHDPYKRGLTKREWMATHALSGLLVTAPNGADARELCREAIGFADMLLFELGKKQPPSFELGKKQPPTPEKTT